MERTKTIVIFILIILCGIGAYTISKANHNLKEQENLQEALNAQLETWKDKDSLNHAKIQVLETRNTRDFLALKTNDSLVMELQKTVKDFGKYLKKQGSATIVEASTDFSTSSETEIGIDPTDSLYPTYKSYFNLDGWVIGESFATKDSTTLSMSINNKYSVIIGREGQTLFKPGKPFVEVINENPYTQVKQMRTYQVSLPEVSRWGIGPVGAYGFSMGKTAQVAPFIGIGVQYSVIRF